MGLAPHQVRAFHGKILFFFSLSLAIPQFGFLSHVSSLILFSGHSGPVLTLSMQPEPLCPAADMSVWVTSPLGVVVRHLFCVVCFFFFPLLVMFPSEISKLPTDPPVKGFPAVWKLLLLHDSLPRMGLIPNSFVSLFVFYILSYLLSKRMGCLSGCLVSSASIQKLFCGSCSAFKWSFDELVGEKVVFPSYSSAILGLPPTKLLSVLVLKESGQSGITMYVSMP